MAIDTDTRKFSAINVGCPWRGVNSVPSGSLDEPEQFALIYLYDEFAAAAATGGGDAVIAAVTIVRRRIFRE